MGKCPFDIAETSYLETFIVQYLKYDPQTKKKEAALVLASAKTGFHDRFRLPSPDEAKAITAMKRKAVSKVRSILHIYWAG